MLFDDKAKSVMVLAPHTDDGELGCGGTIAKLVEHKYQVVYVAFSAAEQSLLPNLPRDILRQEVRFATHTLGIQEKDCIVFDFEVRAFSDKRQDILDVMINLNKKYAPNIVFLPSSYDTHQDHTVITNEGFRAFKKTTMLGYEVMWNNLDFRTTCFVPLTNEHKNKKIESLRCYKSQLSRPYFSEAFIQSQLITRGVQIGQDYAEAFEVIRLILN